ncbi:sulfite exporter TauE/SafE family protein [Corynebacterium sp. MSK039]|uniref:sulfite exporter TauE/SafE family protein n=1 Tax=Corynebacterium sp. MSK039 TaxID=3050193 RepID=UPI00254A8282|nr:sulfite exporter TauE/SafE family protein [Corynebacterium sp. MSK039]MDK8790882.1 sulfite exporter TauE/SafE family protein [Corynebacterium sp. MSK039]
MRKILLFAIAGLAAQLVDGALGMAFGVTATTVLLITGIGPAAASAAVHIAEVGTTAASGTAHWKLGNVHWPTVLSLGVPGAIGAFLGATVLSKISTAAAEPVVTSFLLLLGLWLLFRSIFLSSAKQASKTKEEKQRDTARRAPRTRIGLGVLGITSGFLDASGGGGWGPMTTSTLLTVAKTQPRKVIGTVSASEFLVSVAASAGFIFGLGPQFLSLWQPVAGLLVGGVIAAPIAAWAVSRINPTVLGGLVGLLLVLLNSSRLVTGGTVSLRAVEIGLAILAVIVLWGLWRGRAGSRAESEPAKSERAESERAESESAEPESREVAPATGYGAGQESVVAEREAVSVRAGRNR